MTNLSHSIRVGQLEIHAEEVGEGSPALVFIHYWGGSRRTWSEVIARLSDRFRCVAMDLRGWGKARPKNKRYIFLGAISWFRSARTARVDSTVFGTLLSPTATPRTTASSPRPTTSKV